jgi:hypothetical protein
MAWRSHSGILEAWISTRDGGYPSIGFNESSVKSIFRLENEFRSDPWVTHRFRKYMAGPKRWPWKNVREMKNTYQGQFGTNFLIGFLLMWPVSVFLANRHKTLSSGVPSVPYNRLVHDFVNLDPAYHARRLFRTRFFAYSAFGGICFAYYFTGRYPIRNEWYSRPDYKPFPAMVPQDSLSPSDQVIMETYYSKYRQEKKKADKRNSTWYRVLFPNDALYETDRNPYVGPAGKSVYNPYNSRYASITSTGHFNQHHND